MGEAEGIVELAPGVTAQHVAEACRSAALAFLRGVSAGWTKRDLAEWLVGPYEAATIASSVVAAPVSVAPPSMSPSTDVDRLTRLMALVRGEARACVHDFAIGREAPHLDEAFAKESIVAAWTQPDGEVDLDSDDDTRASVFVPVNRPGLALGVRVRSLFVVDFLIRPEDFEGDLRECRTCGVVLLEGWSRARRLCELHVRDSGTVPRVDDEALIADLLPLSSRLSR